MLSEFVCPFAGLSLSAPIVSCVVAIKNSLRAEINSEKTMPVNA
jgi:hypothetical protein